MTTNLDSLDLCLAKIPLSPEPSRCKPKFVVDHILLLCFPIGTRTRTRTRGGRRRASTEFSEEVLEFLYDLFWCCWVWMGFVCSYRCNVSTPCIQPDGKYPSKGRKEGVNIPLDDAGHVLLPKK
jgi:hypothetical protein